MRLERITIWQFALIIFVSRSVLSLLGMPVVTAGQAGRDGWIASLVMVLWGIPVVFFYLKLAERHPDQTIFEYANHLLGPMWGRLATLPLLWGFLHYSAVILREYGEVIVSAVLPRTPLVFIMGAMIFVCAVGVRLGIEVLSRSAEILVPLFFVSTVGTIILSLPQTDFSRLAPVGTSGLDGILQASVVPSGFYFLFAALLVIYPSLNQKRRALKSAIAASTLAGLLVTAGVTVALAAYGPNEMSRLRFPLLTMARTIQFSEFIERIETLTVAAWGVGLFLELSIVFYAGARGIALWMNINDHRRLVFPMGSILLTLSLTLFPSSFSLQEFQRAEVIGPYGFLMIFGGPALVWLGSLRHGHRRKDAPLPKEGSHP